MSIYLVDRGPGFNTHFVVNGRMAPLKPDFALTLKSELELITAIVESATAYVQDDSQDPELYQTLKAAVEQYTKE